MPKVTMILTDRDVARTAKIREAAQARSNAHAVSIALSLTNFIVEALENGEDLLLRKPGGEFEKVIMTELAGVARRPAMSGRPAGEASSATTIPAGTIRS